MGSTETPSRCSLYNLNTVFRSSMTAAQAKYSWMYVWLIFVYIYPKVLQECFVRFLVAGVCICVLNNTCTHSAVPVELLFVKLGVIVLGHEHVAKDRRSAVTLGEKYFTASLPHFMLLYSLVYVTNLS